MLNSVFLHECVQAGHDQRDRARQQDPADVQDPGRAAPGRARHGLRPPRAEGYDPLQKFLELFEGVDVTSRPGPARAQELAALPLEERLKRRIIDGERNGLEADLD